MRIRRLRLLAALATLIAFGACTLNPQPLPPLDPDNRATAADGGSFGHVDGGVGEKDSPDAGVSALHDAAPPPADPVDSGTDAADGGADAADAGDAEAD